MRHLDLFPAVQVSPTVQIGVSQFSKVVYFCACAHVCMHVCAYACVCLCVCLCMHVPPF